MTAPTVEITLNGEATRHRAGITIDELIGELGLRDRRVAVEVNLEVVRKDNYVTWALEDGDRVEVVSFVGGG